jgi:hypothetical protein
MKRNLGGGKSLYIGLFWTNDKRQRKEVPSKNSISFIETVNHLRKINVKLSLTSREDSEEVGKFGFPSLL